MGLMLLLMAGTLVFALLAAGVGLAMRILPVLRRTGRPGWRTVGISYAVFLAFFLFLAAPFVLSQLLARASTRALDRALAETPADYGNAFESVEFRSRDGVRLRGWFLPGRGGNPAIVLTHGLFRNRREVLGRSAALNQRGYPVLLFDLRNHGASESKRVSLGFRESLDVLAAVDFLHRRRNQEPVVLMGVSMGAVAASLAAAEAPPAVRALIADSPFLSLQQTVRHHVHLLLGLPAFPFADLLVWNLSRTGGFQAGQLDCARALKRLKSVPVLLLYGERDERMPPSTARLLLEAVPHGEKELVFFPAAGHGAAYRSDPTLYLDTVLDFLRRYGGG